MTVLLFVTRFPTTTAIRNDPSLQYLKALHVSEKIPNYMVYNYNMWKGLTTSHSREKYLNKKYHMLDYGTLNVAILLF